MAHLNVGMYSLVKWRWDQLMGEREKSASIKNKVYNAIVGAAALNQTLQEKKKIKNTELVYVV